MKSKAIKQISLFLCLTMLATLMFSAPISAETGSAIISILSGDEIALGETLKVSANIPSFTQKAELYLDDTSVAEINEEETDTTYIFSAVVPETQTIGTKTIKLVVDGEIADTATVEVYKKTMQGTNNWYQDFTGFTVDSAGAVSALTANKYSANLATGTSGVYIEGIIINNDNNQKTDASTLTPNSYCKYYVGNLNGNTAMVGHYTDFKSGSQPYITPYAKFADSGQYEFSFNIAMPADARIVFKTIKDKDNGTITLTHNYDITNNVEAGQFFVEDTLNAVGENFEAFTPYNIKWVIDMSTGSYKFLVNNIICETGSTSHDFSTAGLNNFRLEVSAYHGGSRETWKSSSNPVFYIDDISSVSYDAAYAPKVTLLSCGEETLVLSDAVIPVGAETVTAVMDTELSSAAAYIEDETGKKVADATINGRNVIADTSAITADGQYYIVVNSSVSGAATKTVIPFKAYYACEDNFLVSTSLKAEGNNVYGSFEAVNSGSAAKDVKFIVCTYDGKELLDLAVMPLSVAVGEKADRTCDFTVKTADNAKVMLWWDSLTDITPVISSKALSLGAQQ